MILLLGRKLLLLESAPSLLFQGHVVGIKNNIARKAATRSASPNESDILATATKNVSAWIVCRV
jgi:hypothetical protein